MNIRYFGSVLMIGIMSTLPVAAGAKDETQWRCLALYDRMRVIYEEAGMAKELAQVQQAMAALEAQLRASLASPDAFNPSLRVARAGISSIPNELDALQRASAQCVQSK